LEREALLASGLREKDKIVQYLRRLDDIFQQFIPTIDSSCKPVMRARALFEWLWEEKPFRYKLQGNYRLHDVIDAQLSEENPTIGNCLGLTVLYNCLLRRMGIIAEALYLEHAFETGPHVLTLLQTEDSYIDIDNILPDAFDYRGHLDDPSRTRWGNRELVADIYHSAGNEFFLKGEWIEALKNYEKALHLNPHYEKAQLNRAILLDKMKGNR